MQLEKTNQTRVCRLIEHMVAQKSADSFRLFCEALVGRYKWLVRDLQADLKVERGEVKPVPEMLQETAALVHRFRELTFHRCRFRLFVPPYDHRKKQRSTCSCFYVRDIAIDGANTYTCSSW